MGSMDRVAGVDGMGGLCLKSLGGVFLRMFAVLCTQHRCFVIVG